MDGFGLGLRLEGEAPRPIRLHNAFDTRDAGHELLSPSVFGGGYPSLAPRLDSAFVAQTRDNA